MPMPPNVQRMDSGNLIEGLILVATERGILMATDSPTEELNVSQQRLDIFTQELIRRLAW
jgi:hypothetical protein